MKNLINIILTLSIIYASDCSYSQNFFDNGEYDKAMAYLDQNSSCLENENMKFLKFKIAFKLENFDLSKNMLDQLLNENPLNQQYINSSTLLTKVLQEYKSSKYTLDNLEVDDAISEYKVQLADEELSKISLFYQGLASAYKKKDNILSASDTLNFEYLDLSVKNFSMAHEINSTKDYQKNILNIAKYLTKQGKVSLKEEDYSSAMAFFQKAVFYDKTYSAAHFYLGNLYFKIEDYTLAIENFKNGLQYHSKNSKILYFTARSFEEIGDLEKAEEFFKMSLDSKPKSKLKKTILLSLGRILYATQQYSSATKYLDDLIKFDSKYSKAYQLLSDIHIDIKEIDKAEQYCLQGIDNDQFAYELYVRLARIYNDKEKYESAVEYANYSLEKAEKFRVKNYGPALIELGSAHVNLCNKVAADDAFYRAKSYDRRQVSQLQDWAKEHYKTACN